MMVLYRPLHRLGCGVLEQGWDSVRLSFLWYKPAVCLVVKHELFEAKELQKAGWDHAASF